MNGMEVRRVPFVDVLADLAVHRHTDVVGQQAGAVGREARRGHGADEGQRERARVRRLAHATDPADDALGHERPAELDAEHDKPDEDRAVRVDPDDTQQRQAPQPARVCAAPWSAAGVRAAARRARNRGRGPPPSTPEIPIASRRTIAATRPPRAPRARGVGGRDKEARALRARWRTTGRRRCRPPWTSRRARPTSPTRR